MAEDVAAGLAETIRALRGELTAAMEGGADEALRFQLGPVELELTLAITREGGVDGGVRFGVVSFGAKGGITNQDTHRVKLSLQPVVRVADGGHSTPAEIRGQVDREPT
ncbi:trypco2 family protein [Streptomyces sp. NPDC002685]|uniref:trypco2 family protein n=1 Tax=Streptomyces sp. NPDC002685 TaxID=3154540 RepID=UPI003318326E